MDSTKRDEVLRFWYEELSPPQWFKSTPELDEEIVRRFGELLRSLSSCDASSLATTALDGLAAVIALDQFTRTIHRGSSSAFSNDALALAVANLMLERGLADALGEMQRYFLYMPLMHSEAVADQQRSLSLFEALGNESGVHWAKDHFDVIARFGRFPHRNRVLNRESTPEELAYLEGANTYGQ